MEIIIQNLKEMLENRGDIMDSFIEMEKTYTNKDFHVKTKNKYPFFYTDKTCVIICLTSDFKKLLFDEIKQKNVSIEDIVQQFIVNHNNLLNYIIILSGEKKLTTIDKTAISTFDKQIQKAGGIFQDFYEFNFSFNPTKHELVPPHRKLNNEEVKNIMTEYMIKSKSNFPFILKTDIIAKWLGLKIGDIVEITHYNVNSGMSLYYRCCV
jgi:DNA-directed RNA polymerase subunit H (RpoH/RPB5)